MAMSKNLNSLIFAMVLCVVCSLLLTAASTGLKPYQQRNQLVDRQKNILKALGLVSDGQSVTTEQIQDLYGGNVKNLWVDLNGQIRSEAQRAAGDLPLYVQAVQGVVQAYVVPIDSRGLWGRIHGYLAIASDGATVKGFSVYQHQETPGLGGEIESGWFRENFVGKKIVTADGRFVSVRIAKGRAEETVPADQRDNYVDGISGATMTGKFLSEGMEAVLSRYESVAIQFRQGKAADLRLP
jgi:Na+-transporting NADH:ubiquinone oxidoreductase subunit C